jgi:hypothetical protein
MRMMLPRAAVAAALLAACAAPADAQIFEAVGTRAQGMAGAFVAVANDSTATWWNPAGLASGPYGGLTLERGQVTQPGSPSLAGPARRDSASGFSLGMPSMGLSYYLLRVSEIRPQSSTANQQAGRQDQGPAAPDLRSIAVRQFGLTIDQSVGHSFVVGSTLKLLHGGVATSSGTTATSGSDLLDQADDGDVAAVTRGDIDIGAMVSTSHLRLGVNVKHVNQPSLGNGDDSIVLERQARAGVAILTNGYGVLDGLTFAGDIDLTRTPTAVGDVQHVAGGIEGWFLKRRIGVRGGISTNRVEPSATSASEGLSVALRTSVFVDGALTSGSDQSRNGWNVGLRVTF